MEGSNSADSAAAGILSRPYRAMTLGMICLIFLLAFEALAVATAMPTVAKSLQGLPLYALAFAGTMASSVIGIVFTGRWCDRSGPARPLWTGVALLVAGLLIAGLAPTMTVLLLGRIVQGFGIGGIAVSLYVMVARLYPEALQPKIFAAFSAAWVVPSLIGPAISGLIVEQLGWRWVFLAVPLAALPAAASLRPALRALPPAAAPKPQPTADLYWAVVAAVSICVLHIGGQRAGPASLPLLAAGLAGLVFGARSLLPAGTLRARRGLPSVMFLRALAAAAFFGSEAFIPLMLTQIHGYSPLWSGAALSAGAVGWSSGSWYQGHTSRTWSRVAFLRAGFSLMTLGALIVGSAVLGPVPGGVAAAGWLVTGLGMGLSFPSLSVLMLKLSSPQDVGRNSSAIQLCDSLSVASVLALGGSLFAALYQQSSVAAFAVVFAISTLLPLLGVVLSGRVRRTAAD